MNVGALLAGEVADPWELGIRSACETVTGDAGREHAEWRHDPVGWAEWALGIPAHTLRWSLSAGYEDHEWDGTPDPIARMMDAVAEGKNAGVEAGTGTGKSFGCAVLTLWFLACWENARVFSYAPTERQLRLFMWAEIAHLWGRFKKHFPMAELTDLRIRMRPRSDKWGAFGFAVQLRAGEESATAAQGAHAEHALFIVEEGPGVDGSVYTALENTRTGEHNLQVVVGNPDSVDDELHRWCLQPNVEAIRASALDFPNVVTGLPIVPGAVGRQAVETRRTRYKDQVALFDSRVRGIAPRFSPGLVCRVEPARHLQGFTPAMAKVAVEQGWRFYAGIDFGAWRFAWILGAVDRVGRLWIVEELFSGFGVSLRDRAEQIGALLEVWGVPRSRLTMVGDSANPQDIIEINRAFRRLELPWQVGAVKKVSGGTTGGYRVTAAEKLQTLLAHDQLLFRRGLGAELEWKLGASTTSDGESMTGSRLLWELGKWAYPDPLRVDQAQKQDPDDDTADGADAIAALRYLVMTWLRAAPKPTPKRKVNRNADAGLAELQANLRRIYQGGNAA